MSRPCEHGMTVRLVKLSDRRHRVELLRDDGTRDAVELDTRSFLRHDLAHYAVEATLSLDGGVWGSIAAGGTFDGSQIDGPDVPLAERLAGPVQTLMRVGADVDAVHEMLGAAAPERADERTAEALHASMRVLAGRWSATRYGDALELRWPARDTDTPRC